MKPSKPAINFTYEARISRPEAPTPGDYDYMELHLDPKQVLEPGMDASQIHLRLETLMMDTGRALQEALAKHIQTPILKTGKKYILSGNQSWRMEHASESNGRPHFTLREEKLHTSSTAPALALSDVEIAKQALGADRIIIPYHYLVPEEQRNQFGHHQVNEIVREVQQTIESREPGRPL